MPKIELCIGSVAKVHRSMHKDSGPQCPLCSLWTDG